MGESYQGTGCCSGYSTLRGTKSIADFYQLWSSRSDDANNKVWIVCRFVVYSSCMAMSHCASDSRPVSLHRIFNSYCYCWIAVHVSTRLPRRNKTLTRLLVKFALESSCLRVRNRKIFPSHSAGGGCQEPHRIKNHPVNHIASRGITI